MEFISENKISEELTKFFDKKINNQLATRLDEDKYEMPLTCFKDLYSLRFLAINRFVLISDYIHLLVKKPFYENKK